MIEETYKILSAGNRTFFFYSFGDKGAIIKAVTFQRAGKKFNLAFGDIIDGEIDDTVISGNRDIIKVISAVAKCVYLFVNKNPGSTIIIDPVDEKRRRLYNHIFKRRQSEIEQHFVILGKFGKQTENYNPKKEYDSFEIIHKNLENE